MIKITTFLTLLTLFTFSASLDVTSTVVSDKQKMIDARYKYLPSINFKI